MELRSAPTPVGEHEQLVQAKGLSQGGCFPARSGLRYLVALYFTVDTWEQFRV